MRHVVVVLASTVLAVSALLPAVMQAASPAPNTPPPVSGVLRAVDRRLDTSLRAMRAAEEIADRRHLRGIDGDLDRGLRMAREAEEKVDQVLAIVRGLMAQEKPARADVERAERLLDEALRLTRGAEATIDLALKHRPEDAQRLGGDLKVADNNADAAIRMLRRIIERL